LDSSQETITPEEENGHMNETDRGIIRQLESTIKLVRKVAVKQDKRDKQIRKQLEDMNRKIENLDQMKELKKYQELVLEADEALKVEMSNIDKLQGEKKEQEKNLRKVIQNKEEENKTLRAKVRQLEEEKMNGETAQDNLIQNWKKKDTEEEEKRK
jgi:phosphomevalonate kinase